MDCDFSGTKEGFDEQLQRRNEAYKAWDDYVAKGVCTDCGACSAKEAETKCRATLDITDEYSCAGDHLWGDQR